jgi:hypothetical protein
MTQNQQHAFFRQFGGQPPQQQVFVDLTPEMHRGVMMMELSNNWKFVRWLLYRRKEGLLKTVDQVENNWLNFLDGTGIDIDKYDGPESFLDEHLPKTKSPEVIETAPEQSNVERPKEKEILGEPYIPESKQNGEPLSDEEKISAAS